MALAHIFSGSAQPKVVAGFFRTASPVSLVNNAMTKQLYGSTGYNFKAVLDSANSRFLIPEDGIYIATLKGVFGSNSAGYRALGINRNEALDEYENFNPITGNATEKSITYHPRCFVGDRLEMYAFQNSGAAPLTGCFFEFYVLKVGELS